MNAKPAVAGCLAALCLASQLSMGPAAAASTAVQPLRIAALDVSSRPRMDAVVVVPPAVAATSIAASAFTLRQQGRQIPMSVSRVTDVGLDVVLLLDTAAGNTALPLEQSAASDLLRALPATVRTAAVTPGGAVPTPQPGILPALRELASVRRQPLTYLPETLSAVATAPITGRRRVIVLFTTCRTDTASGFPGLAGDLQSHAQQLDIVAAGSGCGRALSSLAVKSGGLALLDLPSDRLSLAVDTIARDSTGQYQVKSNAVTGQTPVTLSVETAGVRAATTVAITATAAPSRTGRRTQPLLPALAVVAALILIGTGIGAVASWYRPRANLNWSA